jgi:hypothetical protein
MGHVLSPSSRDRDLIAIVTRTTSAAIVPYCNGGLGAAVGYRHLRDRHMSEPVPEIVEGEVSRNEHVATLRCDDDTPFHEGMQAAEVIKGSCRVELEAELVFGVERRRSEPACHSHHVMRRIVAILPNYGAADRHADGLGLECKVVNRNVSFNGVGGIKNARCCCTRRARIQTIMNQRHDVNLVDLVGKAGRQRDDPRSLLSAAAEGRSGVRSRLCELAVRDSQWCRPVPDRDTGDAEHAAQLVLWHLQGAG